MSQSTVPVPTPPRRRSSRLEAAWQWLLRATRRPLVRRLAVTVLLCAATTGLVSLSWATADADPSATKPPVAAAKAGGGPATAGEQSPSPRPSPRVTSRRRGRAFSSQPARWSSCVLTIGSGGLKR